MLRVRPAQLIFLLGQEQQAALRISRQRCRLDLDTRVGERFARAFQISLIDLQRSAGASDLDRRVIRIEIGSGINKTDRQHRQDQYVFPQRVFVQHHAARL